MNIIEKLPIPVSGLVLALFSTGNLLQDIHPGLRYAFGFLASVFLILLILKVILYPNSIREDFKNPVIVSSSGTFSMSLMLLSTYLQPITPGISYTLWIIGIVLHILLVIYFTYHFIIRNFDISTVYPSYWIAFVGITMGAITSPAYNLTQAGFIFFLMGFIGMLLSTPLILYRQFIYKKIPDMNKPLTCIFTALFSILIVGYSNTSSNFSAEFLMGMYAIACVFYIFAIYKFISYRNLDFYPSFAAFTFPFVISALATKSVVSKISSNILFNNILNIETAVAVVLVIYILLRYINFLKKS